jgi:hypothetical protein
MDIWVKVDTANATKLGRVLERFGFRDVKLTSGEFLKPDGVFRLGSPPLQIDILSDVSGCNFAVCYSRRTILSQNGVDISVLSLDDLKANKRAAGRPKDLGDLDGLNQ